jgi:MFS transporter, UMF1 family
VTTFQAAREEAVPASRAAVAAWCLFDWANSAFPTVVTTFLFSAYFINYVAADPATGQSQWGLANGLAALAIAILSPMLGAVADQGGRRKPWLFLLSLVTIVATTLLWFVRPHSQEVALALIIVGVATLAFELGTAFYNAMLPDLVPRNRLGRVSGWGWALGYAGGLACMLLSLVVFVQPDPAPFGLDRSAAEHVRIVPVVAALWFALFALPLFLFVPDRRESGKPMGAIIRAGIADLVATLSHVRTHGNIARFLLAKMIYIDGLNTLFIVGGTYAAGTFGMSVEEVLYFGILLNVSGGLGAFLFAWVDDWIGAKPTILVSVAALTLLGGAVLFVETKLWFYVLATAMGVFLGPTQAASRSLMARLAPAERRTEFFGLYNLAGKVTTPIGPLLVSAATYAFASQRAGMATILPFFIVGFLLLLFTVREPRDG